MSWEDMVFWRVMGWKDDEDEAEDLEAGWSIVATGIIRSEVSPEGGKRAAARVEEFTTGRQRPVDQRRGCEFAVHSRQV